MNHHTFHSFNPLGPVLHTSTATHLMNLLEDIPNDAGSAWYSAVDAKQSQSKEKDHQKASVLETTGEILEQFFFREISQKACHQRHKWESTHRIFFVRGRYTVSLLLKQEKLQPLTYPGGRLVYLGPKKHVDMEKMKKTRIEIVLGQESSYTLFSWAQPWSLLDLGSFFKTLRNVHWKQVFLNVGATILFRFIPSWIANVEKSIFPSRPETPRSIQLHPKTAACAMAKVGRWSWPSNASTQQGSLMTWPIGPTSSINWHQFLHHQSIKSWIHPWYWMGKPDHGITCPQVSCSFGYFLAYEKAMGQKSSTHHQPNIRSNNIHL